MKAISFLLLGVGLFVCCQFNAALSGPSLSPATLQRVDPAQVPPGASYWSVQRPLQPPLPVLAVKPDGTKLFMAWYDRRADANNGLMEVYGRWGSIETNGAVQFEDEFRITPVSFPPVFSGTDTNRFKNGDYDPVLPPGNNDTTNVIGVNLQWWYPEWPPDRDGFEVWKWHVGEYNGAFVTDTNVVFTWTDNRIRRSPISNRHQSDIRLLRLPWP